MKQHTCQRKGCQNLTENKMFCSKQCSNAGVPRRTRKCADGKSICSMVDCDCNGRKTLRCVGCGEPRSKYSTRYCNKGRCKVYGVHGTLEKLEAWLAGADNAGTVIRDGSRCNLASWARVYLLEEAGYKCTKCGWDKPHELTGKPPLEVDHVDGNRHNNAKSNLRVLCPNCHALTLTYRRYNYKHVQELKQTAWSILNPR